MEAATFDTERSIASVVGAVAKPASRLLYIDNIRIYLTVLVILHHLMAIYTGSGGWIYHEGREDEITNALGGWFSAVNQAYFMGLFLLISAYFVPGAYARKGQRKFLTDRLIRLGIPLAVYSWVIRPLFLYLVILPGANRSFLGWYVGGYFRDYGLIGGGPLWFIEALLLFSIAYALLQPLVKSPLTPLQGEASFPGGGAVILCALLIGFASFLVRLVSPVNDTFLPLNFQFANFPQYITLFILGLAAYHQGWLAALPDKTGRRWLGFAIFLILIYAPLGLLLGAAENDEVFLGGWHYQALVYALWEAFICLSMCIGLVYLFRRYLDRQGSLARELSRGAYTAYLIHEPVITYLAILTAGVMLHPLLKFVLAPALMIPVCFALSRLIRRLPYARRVL